MPITVPTTQFDPAKTIIPVKSTITFTPTVNGTPGTAVSVPLKNLSYKPNVETTRREVPNAKGAMIPDRIVLKARTQILTAEIDEFADLPAIFGGAAMGIDGGLARGTVEVFVADSDDAATKIALHSNIFKAVWNLDGDTSFASGEVAKTSIKIEALEDVVLTPDAALT